MRVVFSLVLAAVLAGCGIRPLTDDEITLIDDRCPQELYLAGECDDPPLVPKGIGD